MTANKTKKIFNAIVNEPNVIKQSNPDLKGKGYFHTGTHGYIAYDNTNSTLITEYCETEQEAQAFIL